MTIFVNGLSFVSAKYRIRAFGGSDRWRSGANWRSDLNHSWFAKLKEVCLIDILGQGILSGEVRDQEPYFEMKEEARLSMLNELMEPRILRDQMLQRVFYAEIVTSLLRHFLYKWKNA